MANDKSINSSSGDAYEISGEEGKWTGQEIGVNSDIPLVDEGKGKKMILRQFEFAFDPNMLQKIREKKYPSPTKQELFNSNWKQIEITLWGDGLIAMKEVEPRIIVGKKKYKIIVLCEARMGVVINDKVRTLQEVMKPTKLKSNVPI